MTDTLKKRAAAAKSISNSYPSWVSASARFEGGENIRQSTVQANRMTESHNPPKTKATKELQLA